MREVGIDISKQKSKEITEEMIRDSNYILNKECMIKFLSELFLPKVIEWKLEDPKGKGKSLEEVREIRDEIEERIKELVADITTITPTER